MVPWWPAALASIDLALAALATAHVLLYKRHARAAAGWVGLLWFAPFVGVALYAIFGVNRLPRKATWLRGSPSPRRTAARAVDWSPSASVTPDLRPIAEALDRTVGLPLTSGNAVTLLQHGDEAYPAMLEAIEHARHTLAFCTYIFDRGRWGLRFTDALVDAQRRGVKVRILVDGIGSLYSFPPAVVALRRRGLDAHAFLLSLLPWRMAYLNLRNHRKILVVDGRVGFTGGMNVRDHHVLRDGPRHPTADLHFRLEGPVVRQLLDVFALDWAFTAGEATEGAGWYPPLPPRGQTFARAIPDGPDEDLEHATWTIMTALAAARSRVRIVTPYFLPDEELIGVINATALRGVLVDVILPETNNLGYLTWATHADLPRLLVTGVRVWFTPGQFDHSKLVVVDGQWVLFGSANIDPRSLRLNFELLVEAYDDELGQRADALCDARLRTARRVTLGDLEARSLAVQLRDGAVRLFKPYL